MKSLAVGIPTYNRSDIIEELLSRCSEAYKKVNFDVYIYDSSENTATKTVVEKFQEKYKNLFYISIDSSIHANMKAYMIYEQLSREAKYDYIWLCSDAIRWSEKAFFEIRDYLKQSYDMVILNHHDLEKLGTRVYVDKDQLLADCGWITTLFGTTILKRDTILGQIDWKYYIGKYSVPEMINFSHVILYFEQLSRMKNVKVIHISIEPWEFAPSPLKKHSGWHQDTFEVWCHYWPVSIMSLPSCYTEASKKLAIKKHGMYAEILTLENFLYLKNDRVLSITQYLRYRRQWNGLTDVNPLMILVISLMPSWIAAGAIKKCSRFGRLKRPIKRFYKNYPHIYIYGCGYNAGEISDYLDSLGIQYNGFLVSVLNNEKERFKNHEVKQYSDLLFTDPKAGIILGLNRKYYREVLKQFDNPTYRKRIFSEFDVLGEK